MHATPTVLRFSETSRRNPRAEYEDPDGIRVVGPAEENPARKLITVRDSRSTLPRIVPLWLIRQIDRELRSGGCDRGILSTSCRGLESGSRRFEQAYIAARVESYTRRKGISADCPPLVPPVIVTVMPEFQSRSNHSPNPPGHSLAVLHGGHLMQHFGIWIVSLLTLQALSVWKIGAFAERMLTGSGGLHAAAWLCLLLAFNLRVWFLYYGKDSKAFHTPGICLFLLSILPVFLLHQLAVLKSPG